MGVNQIVWYENKTPQKYACVLRYALGNKSAALPKFRAVRDNYLAPSPAGRSLVESYYTGSARIIEFVKFCAGLKNFLLH